MRFSTWGVSFALAAALVAGPFIKKISEDLQPPVEQVGMPKWLLSTLTPVPGDPNRMIYQTFPSDMLYYLVERQDPKTGEVTKEYKNETIDMLKVFDGGSKRAELRWEDNHVCVEKTCHSLDGSKGSEAFLAGLHDLVDQGGYWKGGVDHQKFWYSVNRTAANLANEAFEKARVAALKGDRDEAALQELRTLLPLLHHPEFLDFTSKELVRLPEAADQNVWSKPSLRKIAAIHGRFLALYKAARDGDGALETQAQRDEAKGRAKAELSAYKKRDIFSAAPQKTSSNYVERILALTAQSGGFDEDPGRFDKVSGLSHAALPVYEEVFQCPFIPPYTADFVAEDRDPPTTIYERVACYARRQEYGRKVVTGHVSPHLAYELRKVADVLDQVEVLRSQRHHPRATKVKTAYTQHR